MKYIVAVLSFVTLVELVLSSIPKKVIIDHAWKGGAQGHLTIRPPIPVTSWILHLHFDRPVDKIEVWKGHVIRHSRTDFDIENMNYDGAMQANQELYFDFVVRGNFDEHRIPNALYYTSLHPDYHTMAHSGNTAPSGNVVSTAASATPFKLSAILKTTPRPTTPSATTSKPSTTVKTTTQVPPSTSTQKFICKKVQSVIAVARHENLTSEESNKCDEAVGGSNEDMVLSLCNVSNPSNWHRGPKVMDTCPHIPLYTPVATFYPNAQGTYKPKGAQSGIFVGCLASGFRMMVQHCHSYAVIEHIEVGGMFTQDPEYYFVIV